MNRDLAVVAGVGGVLLALVGAFVAFNPKAKKAAAAALGGVVGEIVPSLPLSPHFTLGEMLVSTTAADLGITNLPTPDAVANLRTLAVEVLEPVRLIIGAPMRITSGYRSAELNRALARRGYKPARDSDHLTGRAADFQPIGPAENAKARARAAYHLIRARIHELPIDQLIFYPEEGHIHVGYRSNPRREAWIVGEESS